MITLNGGNMIQLKEYGIEQMQIPPHLLSIMRISTSILVIYIFEQKSCLQDGGVLRDT